METRKSYQYIPNEFLVIKSDKQKQLEEQGCVFRCGQEWLDNHEIDPTKDCYCGRPLNPSTKREEI